MGHRMESARRADRVSIEYDDESEAYHLLLYRNGYLTPFAECSFTKESLCDMIDADTEARTDQTIRIYS